MTWQSDVNLLCSLVEKDKKLLDKLGKHLRDEEKEILEAVVAAKGDPKSLVEQLGPIAIAKLKARGVSVPPRYREPAGEAWKVIREPLKLAWRPPGKPTAPKLAQLFLDKYGEKLTTLTAEAKAVDKAVASLASSLRSAAKAKELADAAKGLQTEAQNLSKVVKDCTHKHHDAAAWAKQCGTLARESAQITKLAHDLSEKVGAMGDQLTELADGIREWTAAKPIDRAERAEAMALRLRAASDAVAAMREDFLALVYHA